MKFKTLLCGILLPAVAFAQNKDIPGYYIDNSNVTHQVNFKQADFSNANDIQFRTGDGNFQNLAPEKVKEYGIGDDFKVVRQPVTYDTNALIVNPTKVSADKTENVFLNVLVEGDASLYCYTVNGSEIFFFNTKSEPNLVQLVHKKYQESEVDKIIEVNTYRAQLFQNMKCEGMDYQGFNTLKYDKTDLVRLFESYNGCKKASFKTYKNKAGNHTKVSLSIIGAINYTSFSVEHNDLKSKKDSKLSYGIGVEAALLFPSNTSSIFVRLDYEKFDNETVNTVNYTTHQYNLTKEYYTFDSGAFQVFAGYRYKFSDKIYADAALGFNIPGNDIDEVVKFPEAPNANPAYAKLQTGSNGFFSIGAGYMISQRFGVEARFNTPRNLFEKNINAKSQLTSIGLNVRYVLN